MQNDVKIVTNPAIAALLAVAIFIILPLIIAIISIIIQIALHISVKDALQSNLDENTTQIILEQNNIDPENTVVHKVMENSDWLAVTISSASPNELGNDALVVLNRQNDNYETVYIGTNYDENTLTNLGIPTDIAKKLATTGSIPDYGEVIYNSYLNPDYKYPLIQSLPFYTDRLSITYYFEDDLKDADGTSIPIIKISGANAAERSNALDKIRRLGYDPGDYYIKFINLDNPFVEESVEEIIKIDINEENQGP